MGYSHYINKKPAFTDRQWREFRSELRTLLDKHSDILANGTGDRGTKPRFKRDVIYFNGIGEDAHETCCIYKAAKEFEFCKTARKPYDKVVVAAWKLVRDFLPSTELSSDGGEAVFGNVVVVEKGNRLLTYSAGPFAVNIGDTVILPPTPQDHGAAWEAKVVSLESDYEGSLKEILGVSEYASDEPDEPETNQSAIVKVLMDNTSDITLYEAEFLAVKIVEVLAERIKHS